MYDTVNSLLKRLNRYREERGKDPSFLIMDSWFYEYLKMELAGDITIDELKEFHGIPVVQLKESLVLS